ncbi:MAG: LysM peptidoglycan-binding domain-containing protein [Anaerolineae bacterium]
MRRIIGVGLGLVMFLAFFSPVAAAPPADGWGILGTHTVQSGETLYCIGRAYGVDPWAIAQQNGILYANLIYPGTILQIPNVPATLPDGPICERQFDGEPDGEQPEVIRCGPEECLCEAQHVVKTGETLMTLAIHYDVPMWELARCNCIYNLNYIRIGDTLCIPAGD